MKTTNSTNIQQDPIFLAEGVLNGKKDLSVKQIITTLCRVKAWKYTDLAREVGIAKQTLNNYMNGRWGVPSGIKLKIARALEVDSSVIWDLK